MRRFAAVAFLALSGHAFAHGGNLGGTPNQAPPNDPGPPLGPGWHTPDLSGNAPLTPSTTDPDVAVTQWESWWSANKEALMRLGERMRAPAPNTTGGRKKSERELTWEDRREEASRKRLAALFVEALSDPDFEVRTAAAIALGKSGDAVGSEPLRAATKDSHKDVGDSAVLGLGLLGRPTDLPFLEQILFDREKDPRRRGFAAFSIGLIGGEDAAVSLLRIFDGERGAKVSGGLTNRPELTSSVFVAMGLTACPDVLPVLRRAIHDQHHDSGVRAFAMISLGRLRDRGSLSSAVGFLVHERDLRLRRAAAVAMGNIVRPDDLVAVDALVSTLRDKDPLVRHFAAMALGRIPAPRTRDALRLTFKEGDDDDRPFAALALALQHDVEFAPELRAALPRCKDESAASNLCLALALLPDPDAAPLIEKQLDAAKRPWLASYAALGLGLLGNTPSADLLRARLQKERDGRVRMNLAVALGLLHDAAAKTYFVETLRGDGYMFERGSAAMALGALRLASAVPDLEALYRDRREKDLLRAFAVVALGQIADPSPVPKLSSFSIDGDYSGTARVDPLREVLSIY